MRINLQLAFVIFIISFILSCASNIGKDFCLASGYQQGSAQFKQCQARYQTQSDLYEYCKVKQGIVSVSPNLQSCLNKALQLKNNYSPDEASCNTNASAKYYQGMMTTRLEEQTVITPDFRTATTLVQISDPLDYNAIISAQANYVRQCLAIKGWPNASWFEGKQNVSRVQIDNGLRQLNSQNILSNIVGNRNVTLLHKAASEGNLSVVSGIIDSRQAGIEDVNHQGYTALHFAAVNGNLPMVRHLVEIYNANFDARGKEGYSVNDLAVKSRNNQLVTYLYDRQRQQQAIIYNDIGHGHNKNHGGYNFDASNWNYAGCYKDENPEKFSRLSLQNGLMTNRFCQKYCGKQGYKYAAIRNGDSCYCADGMIVSSKKSDKDCRTPCAGNPNEKCGGFVRSSVWLAK